MLAPTPMSHPATADVVNSSGLINPPQDNSRLFGVGISFAAHQNALVAVGRVGSNISDLPESVVLWSAIPVQTPAAATGGVPTAPAQTPEGASAPVLLPHASILAGAQQSSSTTQALAGRLSSGPVLAMSGDWIAYGAPGLFSNSTGGVILWDRTAESIGTAEPAVLTPAVSDAAVTSRGGHLQAWARSAISDAAANPWTAAAQSQAQAARSGGTAGNASAGLPTGMHASRLPVASASNSLRFGAAVALEGSLLAVGVPGLAAPGNEAALAGGVMVFALGRRAASTSSPSTGAPPTEAMLAASLAPPDSTLSTGPLSGPHPLASKLSGLLAREALCGSTVALGGGFLAVGCPALSLPETASAPALSSTGGVLVFRQARPADEAGAAAAWPYPVPEPHTALYDLRGEAQATPAAAAALNATAALRSSAWVFVQLLVPHQASPQMRLGGGSGAAGDTSAAQAASFGGRGAMLAVSSRFLAAAVPGSDAVFVWRRRNGLARAFDPASQQTLSARPVDAAPSNISGLSLVGMTLVAALKGESAAVSTEQAGTAALAVFAADATGIFRTQPAGVAGSNSSGSSNATFGLTDAQCGGQGAGYGVAVAAAGGAAPAGAAVRIVTACDPSSNATSGALAIMDVPAACPRLSEPPADAAQAPVASIAQSRQLFVGLRGGDSPAGECDSVVARPTAEWGRILGRNDTSAGAIGSMSPAALLGAGTTSTCVAACGYGSALASGSQVLTCEGTGSWSLLPDELPFCEHLFSSAESLGRAYQPLDPSNDRSLSPASSPAMGSAAVLGGMYGNDVLIARLRFAAVTTASGVPIRAVAAAASSASFAAQSSLVHPIPASEHPSVILGAVLGSTRALDGMYMATRGNRTGAPVLRHSRTPDGAAMASTAQLPALESRSASSPAVAVLAASGGLMLNQSIAPVGASSTTAVMLGAMILNSSAAIAHDPPRVQSFAPTAPELMRSGSSVVGALDARILLTAAEAVAAVKERLAVGDRGRRSNVSSLHCMNTTAGCISGQVGVDGQSLDREVRGPAADPRVALWASPATSLDPLVASTARIDAALAVPAARPAILLQSNASTTTSNSSSLGGINTTTDVAISTPQQLAAVASSAGVGADSIILADTFQPYLRFHPAGFSPIAANLSAVRMSHEGDAGVAGHLALSDVDPLGSEALLAPMTWHDASVDVDVALSGSADGALGGAALLTTLPMRLCCATGRGRVPADSARRLAGPQRTRVVLTIRDMYSVSDWTQPVVSGSPSSFLDALLAQISVRLGNVSAAAAWAGVPTPDGRVDNATAPAAPPGLEQLLTEGTAALDVPGASVRLVRFPEQTWTFSPSVSANTASRITGKSLPSVASGTSLELEVVGYGYGDPSDASDGCRSLLGGQQIVEPAPPVLQGPAVRVATLSVNKQRGWRASSSLSWQLAADLARLVLRAARQPISWWERRRCVAADIRSLFPASPDAGVPWSAA